MGHHHHRVVLGGELVHTVGHNSECVDVKAGIGLVKKSQAGFEQCHLKYFVALFFSARKPFIDAAVQKIGVHFQQLHLVAHEVVKLQRVEFFLATLFLMRVVRQAKKLAVDDAGHLDRILKG